MQQLTYQNRRVFPPCNISNFSEFESFVLLSEKKTKNTKEFQKLFPSGREERMKKKTCFKSFLKSSRQLKPATNEFSIIRLLLRKNFSGDFIPVDTIEFFYC